MLKVHDKPANAEEQDEDSTLDELAREGARRMLMKALAVEITQYVEEHGGCFRHQLLLPRPYLVLTKPLRLDIQCQRGASVKIGWKYLDD